MTKIICVANQKGGVGKTTTAVNLSASIAVTEKKTLLIDCDPQGNATSGLGIDKNNLDFSLYDGLITGISITKIRCLTSIKFLDILPSKSELIGAEIELVNIIEREKVLQRTLSELVPYYQYIIIDCPPSLGLLTINSLTASDSILIPLQCEYYAMEGIGQLMSTIKLIKRHLNPNLTIEGVLLTMFDTRNNLSHQVASEIKKYFGNKVFRTLIPRNVRLSEAPSYGKPVLLYDIKSKGAISYIELAKEIINDRRRRNE